MGCPTCNGIPRSDPTSILSTIGKKGAGLVTDIFGGAAKKAPSVITRTGAAPAVKTVVRNTASDILSGGVTHGSRSINLPSVVKYADQTAYRNTLTNLVESSYDNFAQVTRSRVDLPLPTKLMVKSPDDLLSVLSKKADDIASAPIITHPERAINRFDSSGTPVLFREPERMAELQGAALSAKKTSDDLIARLAKEQRSLTDDEAKLVAHTLDELDGATKAFNKAPAYDPALLAREARAQADVVFKGGASITRSSDDGIKVLSRSEYDNFRALSKETQLGDELVVDQFGNPLMQRTIRTADGNLNTAYRELTETELARFSRQMDATVDDGVGALSRSIFPNTGEKIVKGANLTKTVAMVGGAATVGGAAALMLMSPAEAIPLGEDLTAYQSQVCDPDGQYYNEEACAAISEIVDVLEQYPMAWDEVCVETSPIYDPEACTVIQAMMAAAQAGVAYTGGTAEDYGGETQMITQEYIDELISRYCHPASAEYNEETCERMKEYAREHGFVVNEPGQSGEEDDDGSGEPGKTKEQPPWDELTPEEIHAIVCDKYGDWYDAELCRQYTEYLKEQGGSGGSGGSSGNGGSGSGGSGTGGSYGSGGAGSGDGSAYPGSTVIYDPTQEIVMCALQDDMCIGWFSYLDEMFYWDGQEFYDAYGNLVYFIWTDEDQAALEEQLAAASTDPVASLL